MPVQPTVLVVDRESDETRALIAFMRAHDFTVVWTRDGEAAFHALDETRVDCLVTELQVHRVDGMNVLRHARERNPDVCAVVVTEGAGIEMAVEAMRQGAYDFQVKPLNLDKLLAVLHRGISDQQLARRAAEMAGRLDRRLGIERLTGRSRAITRVFEQIRHLASARATVLIEGEGGTGKGMVAQAIHHNSPRREERFVWVDCSVLTEAVVEAELFGIEDEAFAGAAGVQRGRFELADGGTLFLEEIGATPPPVQVKLLRVLQDRELERVGGAETLKVDVRLIAATSGNLAAEVRAGRFREDLYQRLSVIRIAMPALRERREDIPLLVDTFIREFNREHGRKVTGISRGVAERLAGCEWPGNVRELRNTVEGMVVSARGRRPLDVSDLPARLRAAGDSGEKLDASVGMRVEELEQQLIAATLRHTGYDKPRTAAMLGIGLRTLYRKIKQFGLV
ncbi:MAG TPA: sigma-54 dependent transcriptional regulator [Candidatus Limnocylindria bacterium]|nr:sigma-54 dependent transcriptional regulator [Candidatus Limnocylindria bacterium]